MCSLQQCMHLHICCVSRAGFWTWCFRSKVRCFNPHLSLLSPSLHTQPSGCGQVHLLYSLLSHIWCLVLSTVAKCSPSESRSLILQWRNPTCPALMQCSKYQTGLTHENCESLQETTICLSDFRDVLLVQHHL